MPTGLPQRDKGGGNTPPPLRILASDTDIAGPRPAGQLMPAGPVSV